MKRYWLFEAQQYYPEGGMKDWVGDYDTIEKAEDARTAKFSPELTQAVLRQKRIEIEKDVTSETYYSTKAEYNKLVNEYEKRDTSYHILDIQTGVIVQGWLGYSEEKIENITIEELKDQ